MRFVYASSRPADGKFGLLRLVNPAVTFFRVKEPMAATEIVTALCKSARCREKSIRSKHVHRLTPVARTGRATLEGLSEVAKKVLAPHFHSGQIGLKVRSCLSLFMPGRTIAILVPRE